MTPKPRPEADVRGEQLSLEARMGHTAPPSAEPRDLPSAPTDPPPAPGRSAGTLATLPPSPPAPVPALPPRAAMPALPPPAPVPEAAPRVYQVSELLRAARLTLESRFAEVRVEGEISGLKRSGSGHVYFCLKDTQGLLDCAMYAREAGRLKFKLEEGMGVRCRGRLTLYEQRGKFQMTVADVEPTGAGALALAFEQLKQKLAAEGLFETARKRPLPFLPRRLGVVTSPTGAVIRDIVRVAHRRCAVPILLSPTPVQGEGAARAIAFALRRLEAVPDVDVIIVARGGGSLEDLWAFNEEPVARAIFACRVPVISAVGHETDFTIADFVADVRAPTPSAAAERAVPVQGDLRTELALLCRRAGRATAERLRERRHALERVQNRLADPRRLLDARRQILDDHAERARRQLGRQLVVARATLRGLEVRLLRAHPQRRVHEQRHALVALRHRLDAAARGQLARRRHAVEAARGKLEALSPLQVLERGFSLAQLPDGRLLTDASDARPGDAVRLRLRRGELDAEVRATHPPDEGAGQAPPAPRKARP
jgi:exodeoxyribonuclease VII large subunit